MVCRASFGNHANFVQAFIIFVEVRKSQLGESSASFNLHPFRIMQTMVWKWDNELRDPEFSVTFLHNSYICILHTVYIYTCGLTEDCDLPKKKLTYYNKFLYYVAVNDIAKYTIH